MTTGSVSTNTVCEVLPDGWKLYEGSTRFWSGGDSPSSPPVKTKSYHIVVQPPVIRTRYVRRRFEYDSGLPGLSGKTFFYKKVPEQYEKYPARSVQKRYFPPLARTLKRDPHNYSLVTKHVREDWFDALRNGSAVYSGIVGEQLAQGADYIWSPDDDYRLLAQLQDRVAGSTFHLGNFLGEGSKTLSMISSIAGRTAKSLSLLKKGRLPAALKVLQGKSPTDKQLRLASKDPASAYLEFIYGVRPLLKDAYEGAQMLGYLSSAPRSHRTTVTRNAGGYAFRTVEKQIWGFTPASTLRCKVEVLESHRIICNQRELDPIAVTGLLDPMSVAWEVLPYSFVADWFLPIGSYLQALNFVSSLDATFIVIKRRRSRGWSPYMVNTNSSDQFALRRRPVNWVSEQFVLERSVSNTFVVPKPKVKALSKSASFTHCVTSLALLVSKHGS